MKFVLKAKRDLKDCDNNVLYEEGKFYTEVIDNHTSLCVYGENNEFNEVATIQNHDYNWARNKQLNEDFEIYILKEDIPLREYKFVLESFKPSEIRGEFKELYEVPAWDKDEALNKMRLIAKSILNQYPRYGEMRFNEEGYSQGHYVTDIERLRNLLSE